MGGGTGLPQLLRGLKKLSRSTHNRIDMAKITAIVTAFDDGGSSGRIIQDYEMLPPGDLRRCLIALADEQSEPLLVRFLEHRFDDKEHDHLAGHSVGNLLLLALTQIHGGDFRKALLSVTKLLSLQSTILFPTLSPATLCARLSDGHIIRGESHIAQRRGHASIASIFLEHRDDAATRAFEPMDGVLEAIDTADLISLGPGSLFTSVLPHFLVDGIVDALNRTSARRVYICNLMTEVGETDNFSVGDHLRHLNRMGVNVDAVIVNNRPLPPPIALAYEEERCRLSYQKTLRRLDHAFNLALHDRSQTNELEKTIAESAQRLSRLTHRMAHPEHNILQVLVREEEDIPEHVAVIQRDLLAEEEIMGDEGRPKTVIRHDPEKLARCLLELDEGVRADPGGNAPPPHPEPHGVHRS